MSARATDLRRIQEMYDVVCQTLRDLEKIGMNEERYLHPVAAEEVLICEGLTNRVFRVAEEGGQLEDEHLRRQFGSRAMGATRNIIAHAYGEVRRDLLWQVLAADFPKIKQACEAWCTNHDIELSESGVAYGATEGWRHGSVGQA